LPKSGYLGVTAATGGLADDHDVLEFLTNTYSDKQATAQNQGATDEQARKYKEEYEKYEQDLKKQQAEFVLDFVYRKNLFSFLVIKKNIRISQHQLMNKR
jgi:mannose-binding lectin 1